MVTGNRTAATPTLFMKADAVPAVSMTTKMMRASLLAREADNLAPDQVGDAGVRKSPTQDEDGPDRHDRGVRESCERLGRFDKPGHGQEHEREECDQVHWDSAVHEEGEIGKEDPQDEHGLDRQQRILTSGREPRQSRPT